MTNTSMSSKVMLRAYIKLGFILLLAVGIHCRFAWSMVFVKSILSRRKPLSSGTRVSLSCRSVAVGVLNSSALYQVEVENLYVTILCLIPLLCLLTPLMTCFLCLAC